MEEFNRHMTELQAKGTSGTPARVALIVMCDDSGPMDKLKEFISDVNARYPDCIVDDYGEHDYSDEVETQFQKLEKRNRKCFKEGKPAPYSGLLINYIADNAEDALRDESECYVVKVDYVARRDYKKDDGEETDEEFAEIEEGLDNCYNSMGFYSIQKNQTIPEFVDELFGPQKA